MVNCRGELLRCRTVRSYELNKSPYLNRTFLCIPSRWEILVYKRNDDGVLPLLCIIFNFPGEVPSGWPRHHLQFTGRLGMRPI